MIGLLNQDAIESEVSVSDQISAIKAEDHLIDVIYRFAHEKDEWFNLLLGLSNCIALADNLPAEHPYQQVATRVQLHLKTALSISARLSIDAIDDPQSVSLDKIPVAALIIDAQSRVVAINQGAQDYVKNLQGWHINNGALAVEGKNLPAQISASPEEVLAVPLGQDHKALVCHLYGERGGVSQRFYICFEAPRSSLVNAQALKRDFGLTDTETLVVEAVVVELSTEKASTRLRLKESSVREHLSHIYQKLGVQRRPEMVQKVLMHNFYEAQVSSDAGALSLRSSDDLKSTVLSDGRRMSYYLYEGQGRTAANKQGESTGTQGLEYPHTVLLLHNLMGSAYELPPGSKDFFDKHRIRVLVPERPGYGGSDPMPGGTHEGWCKDLKVLLDELNINKVRVIAHSIGGAYALAMAEYMPEYLERTAMVNAVARIEDMKQAKPVPILMTSVFQSLRFAPFLIEPILKMALGKSVRHFYEQQLKFIRPTLEGRAADIQLLRSPSYKQYSLRNLEQSCRQGVSAWSDELKLSFSPWKFEPKNKDLEYQFWHGDQDDVISIGAAERLAADLNTISFNRITDETHFLYARHFNRVMAELIAP